MSSRTNDIRLVTFEQDQRIPAEASDHVEAALTNTFEPF
jgi:hypothetical protein